MRNTTTTVVIAAGAVLAAVTATQAATIHVDIANCPPSDCCSAHGTTGCKDAECEAIVCGFDPFCCVVFWRSLCADEAAALCGELCSTRGSGTEADPYCSIQTAIDNAVDTDEIVVAEGTYFENINFLGKAITVRSTDPTDPVVVMATIINAGGSGTVVTCDSGEGVDTVLSGFVITGGTTSPGAFGGGMRNISSSSPTVSNCTFIGNFAGSGGGGMYNLSSSPKVTNCAFIGNSSARGGGMAQFGARATVINCTFSGNTASSEGGGIYIQIGAVIVTNCTFTGNTANNSGGGIFVVRGAIGAGVMNTGFCNNTPDAIDGFYFDEGGNSLLYCPPPIPVPDTCPADIDGDGNVGINDFLDLLAAWGPCK